MVPLDPPANLETMYVCIGALWELFSEVTSCQLKGQTLTSFVADSQGNNGRPGKPGDRGAPGPQVRDRPFLNKDQRLTNGPFNCEKRLVQVVMFVFVLNCRVLVDSLEPLDSQE